MAIDRKAYRTAKKKYKSTVKSNEKGAKSDRKFNKKAEKDLEKRIKKEAKISKKTGQQYYHYPRGRQFTPTTDPGDKPKRSDYKSSKPQRATGSTASHGRMEKLTNQVMIKPIDKHWLREKNHAASKQAKLNAQRGRHRGM